MFNGDCFNFFSCDVDLGSFAAKVNRVSINRVSGLAFCSINPSINNNSKKQDLTLMISRSKT